MDSSHLSFLVSFFDAGFASNEPGVYRVFLGLKWGLSSRRNCCCICTLDEFLKLSTYRIPRFVFVFPATCNGLFYQSSPYGCPLALGDRAPLPAFIMTKSARTQNNHTPCGVFPRVLALEGTKQERAIECLHQAERTPPFLTP